MRYVRATRFQRATITDANAFSTAHSSDEHDPAKQGPAKKQRPRRFPNKKKGQQPRAASAQQSDAEPAASASADESAAAAALSAGEQPRAAKWEPLLLQLFDTFYQRCLVERGFFDFVYVTELIAGYLDQRGQRGFSPWHYNKIERIRHLRSVAQFTALFLDNYVKRFPICSLSELHQHTCLAFSYVGVAPRPALPFVAMSKVGSAGLVVDFASLGVGPFWRQPAVVDLFGLPADYNMAAAPALTWHQLLGDLVRLYTEKTELDGGRVAARGGGEPSITGDEYLDFVSQQHNVARGDLTVRVTGAFPFLLFVFYRQQRYYLNQQLAKVKDKLRRVFERRTKALLVQLSAAAASAGALALDQSPDPQLLALLAARLSPNSASLLFDLAERLLAAPKQFAAAARLRTALLPPDARSGDAAAAFFDRVAPVLYELMPPELVPPGHSLAHLYPSEHRPLLPQRRAVLQQCAGSSDGVDHWALLQRGLSALSQRTLVELAQQFRDDLHCQLVSAPADRYHIFVRTLRRQLTNQPQQWLGQEVLFDLAALIAVLLHQQRQSTTAADDDSGDRHSSNDENAARTAHVDDAPSPDELLQLAQQAALQIVDDDDGDVQLPASLAVLQRLAALYRQSSYTAPLVELLCSDGYRHILAAVLPAQERTSDTAAPSTAERRPPSLDYVRALLWCGVRSRAVSATDAAAMVGGYLSTPLPVTVAAEALSQQADKRFFCAPCLLRPIINNDDGDDVPAAPLSSVADSAADIVALIRRLPYGLPVGEALDWPLLYQQQWGGLSEFLVAHCSDDELWLCEWAPDVVVKLLPEHEARSCNFSALLADDDAAALLLTLLARGELAASAELLAMLFGQHAHNLPSPLQRRHYFQALVARALAALPPSAVPLFRELAAFLVRVGAALGVPLAELASPPLSLAALRACRRLAVLLNSAELLRVLASQSTPLVDETPPVAGDSHAAVAVSAPATAASPLPAVAVARAAVARSSGPVDADGHCASFDLIEWLRVERFGIDAAETDQLREMRAMLQRSVRKLSKDLYSTKAHVIFEIVQNADDNSYATGGGVGWQDALQPTAYQTESGLLGVASACRGHPTLTFLLDQSDVFVLNNELGFSAENVQALCNVGSSSKKDRVGYIGQKGIGWKSTFAVSANPRIHSGSFHFGFYDESRADEPFPFVCPHWLGKRRDEAPAHGRHDVHALVSTILDCRANGYADVDAVLSDYVVDGTVTHLPLQRDQHSVVGYFRDVRPLLLLFLRKLEVINILNVSEPVVWMKRLQVNPLVTRIVSTSSSDDYVLLKRVCDVPVARDGVDDASSSLLSRTEVSVALPMPPSRDADFDFAAQSHVAGAQAKQAVFAYLPIRCYGLMFIVNADFVLTATRESINESSPFNQCLRNDSVPQTFLELFAAVLAEVRAVLADPAALSATHAVSLLAAYAGGLSGERAAVYALNYLYALLPLQSQVEPFFASLARTVQWQLEHSESILCSDGGFARPRDVRLLDKLALQELHAAVGALQPAPAATTQRFVHPQVRLSALLTHELGMRRYSLVDVVDELRAAASGQLTTAALPQIVGVLLAFDRYYAATRAATPPPQRRQIRERLRALPLWPLLGAGDGLSALSDRVHITDSNSDEDGGGELAALLQRAGLLGQQLHVVDCAALAAAAGQQQAAAVRQLLRSELLGLAALTARDVHVAALARYQAVAALPAAPPSLGEQLDGLVLALFKLFHAGGCRSLPRELVERVLFRSTDGGHYSTASAYVCLPNDYFDGPFLPMDQLQAVVTGAGALPRPYVLLSPCYLHAAPGLARWLAFLAQFNVSPLNLFHLRERADAPPPLECNDAGWPSDSQLIVRDVDSPLLSAVFAAQQDDGVAAQAEHQLLAVAVLSWYLDVYVQHGAQTVNRALVRLHDGATVDVLSGLARLLRSARWLPVSSLADVHGVQRLLLAAPRVFAPHAHAFHPFHFRLDFGGYASLWRAPAPAKQRRGQITFAQLLDYLGADLELGKSKHSDVFWLWHFVQLEQLPTATPRATPRDFLAIYDYVGRHSRLTDDAQALLRRHGRDAASLPMVYVPGAGRLLPLRQCCWVDPTTTDDVDDGVVVALQPSYGVKDSALDVLRRLCSCCGVDFAVEPSNEQYLQRLRLARDGLAWPRRLRLVAAVLVELGRRQLTADELETLRGTAVLPLSPGQLVAPAELEPHGPLVLFDRSGLPWQVTGSAALHLLDYGLSPAERRADGGRALGELLARVGVACIDDGQLSVVEVPCAAAQQLRPWLLAGVSRLLESLQKFVKHQLPAVYLQAVQTPQALQPAGWRVVDWLDYTLSPSPDCTLHCRRQLAVDDAGVRVSAQPWSADTARQLVLALCQLVELPAAAAAAPPLADFVEQLAALAVDVHAAVCAGRLADVDAAAGRLEERLHIAYLPDSWRWSLVGSPTEQQQATGSQLVALVERSGVDETPAAGGQPIVELVSVAEPPRQQHTADAAPSQRSGGGFFVTPDDAQPAASEQRYVAGGASALPDSVQLTLLAPGRPIDVDALPTEQRRNGDDWGRRGEQLALAYLTNVCSRLGDGGQLARAAGELGLVAGELDYECKLAAEFEPYDLVIYARDRRTLNAVPHRYVEVKSSAAADKSYFHISVRELEFARAHQHQHLLVRVAGLALDRPSIAIVPNLLELLEQHACSLLLLV